MTQYRFFQHNFDENWTIVFKVDNLKNGLNFDQFGREKLNKQIKNIWAQKLTEKILHKLTKKDG